MLQKLEHCEECYRNSNTAKNVTETRTLQRMLQKLEHCEECYRNSNTAPDIYTLFREVVTSKITDYLIELGL